MKDDVLALVEGIEDPAHKLNLLREYLQALALRSLHESEAFLHLAFVGGTALRFLHALPRFSEDLDFSLAAAAGYEPEKWLKKLKLDLSLAGYAANVSWKDQTTVHKSWIRVTGLLHAAGISPMRDQNLSIKLEIDTRPPAGPVLQRTLVNRHRIFVLQHYDLPSLMAGKVHALLTRAYPKGRDWYDWIWYRSKRPAVEPNVPLLQNALDQTQGAGKLNATEWKRLLVERIELLDIPTLVADVRPFLERANEADLFTRENFRSVLRGQV